LVAENVLLRQQLAVLTRPTRWCPRLRARDKLFWVLARLARRDWRRHVVLVTPGTVVHWHRRGWRLFWRWRSRTRLGRPRVSPEVRELIATIARDNLNEAHLRAVLCEFVRYYSDARPDRTLPLETPRPSVRPTAGRIRSRPILAGLHHARANGRRERATDFASRG
jgi:hypothetical protein